MNDQIEQKYLQSTDFIDSASPIVSQFAENVYQDNKSTLENAVALYYKVRDSILYIAYGIDLSHKGMQASETISKGAGFCIQKSILLAAVCRAVDIPSRLGFADVRNHLTSDRLKKLMNSDVFFWHGYTELYIEGKWIKATPAFNLSLCEKFGVKPLEFDGRTDSVFHESNEIGKKHMEYLNIRGHYTDLPYDEILGCFKEHYPFLLLETSETVSGNFDQYT